MRLRPFLLAGLLLLAAIAGGAGCAGPDSSTLASLAPPDAPFYAEIALRPDDDQEAAISALADRVAGIDDPREAAVAELDEAFARGEAGIVFGEDIEPWLGDRAAVFVRSFEPSRVAEDVPDFAVAADLDDVDEARSFLERATESDPDPELARSYRGVDYLFAPAEGIAMGIIDERLVFGTEPSFKVAVDASQGESLAESDEYRRHIEALGGDPIATAFLDPGEVIDAIVNSDGSQPVDARLLRPVLAGPLARPVALGLSASPTSASLGLATLDDHDREHPSASALLEGLPAGSSLALALPDPAGPLRRLLEQLDMSGLPHAASLRRRVLALTGLDLRTDVLPWLGDAAVFVGGATPPGAAAGLIVESDDPRAARALLVRAERLLRRDWGLRPAPPPQGLPDGFRIGAPELGVGAEAGLVGGHLVAVLGGSIDGAVHPTQALADDHAFGAAREALGDEFSPALYIRVPELLGFLEHVDLGGYERATRSLDAFGSLIGGTRTDDGLFISRLTLTLAQ